MAAEAEPLGVRNLFELPPPPPPSLPPIPSPTETESEPTSSEPLGADAGAPPPTDAGVSVGDPVPLNVPTEQVADSLDGVILEIPCSNNERDDSDPLCEVDRSLETQSQTFQIAGDPAKTYLIRLKIQGIAESLEYTAGTPLSGHAYRNGAVPDGFSHRNAFQLATNVPEASYFLNHVPGQVPGSRLFDYEFVIRAQGGSQVKFGVNEGSEANPDGQQYPNSDAVSLVEANVNRQPFDGQFVQLGVSAVVEVAPGTESGPPGPEGASPRPTTAGVR